MKIDFSAQLEFSRLEFQAAITKCGTSDVALVPLGTRLSKTQMELNFHNLPPRICCENVVEVALLKKKLVHFSLFNPFWYTYLRIEKGKFGLRIPILNSNLFKNIDTKLVQNFIKF